MDRICVECNRTIERVGANDGDKGNDREVVGLCARCQDKARRELAPSGIPKRRSLIFDTAGEAHYGETVRSR